jgi:hypothetical protein
MRIHLRARLEPVDALREETERRLRFALGRFEHRIGRIEARFTDLNGPRGGVDQGCQLVVKLLAPSRIVVVEDADVDPRVALSRAADRAARAVARIVAHAHHTREEDARMQEVSS